MQRKCKRTLLSLILSMMLIVAMAFSMTACGDNNQEKPSTGGQTTFNFVVFDKDGNETKFEIQTDKTTVGEALMDAELLEGEEGPYGLYVKTVAGTTLDYDKDKMYWAFYINGEYAMTGVDVTPVIEGETYMFKAEKA